MYTASMEELASRRSSMRPRRRGSCAVAVAFGWMSSSVVMGTTGQYGRVVRAAGGGAGHGDSSDGELRAELRW